MCFNKIELKKKHEILRKYGSCQLLPVYAEIVADGKYLVRIVLSINQLLSQLATGKFTVNFDICHWKSTKLYLFF